MQFTPKLLYNQGCLSKIFFVRNFNIIHLKGLSSLHKEKPSLLKSWTTPTLSAEVHDKTSLNNTSQILMQPQKGSAEVVHLYTVKRFLGLLLFKAVITFINDYLGAH